MPYSIVDLRAYGFVGFVPISGWSKADIVGLGEGDVEGVYAVVHQNMAVPIFIDDLRPVPRRRSRTAAEAAGRWVPGVQVLYFGMAPLRRESRSGRRGGLAQRIYEYKQHGLSGGSNHHGGKLVWQVGDSDDLRIAWKVLPEGQSEQIESGLISGFKKEIGRPPFANTGAPRRDVLPIFL